ncbi:unnamed protein product [Medioppia subpectinata]|uniref:Uncharacterized protein n=1 Tax=Medioppia subpectinata TaxID=1979941 RepID=A0A7R9Q984_9ACAR|nr:unnamed protein product [Medioppia subpectinata]CAG2116125.1 unnamed protein product [Medioppia subpectinata]
MESMNSLFPFLHIWCETFTKGPGFGMEIILDFIKEQNAKTPLMVPIRKRLTMVLTEAAQPGTAYTAGHVLWALVNVDKTPKIMTKFVPREFLNVAHSFSGPIGSLVG